MIPKQPVAKGDHAFIAYWPPPPGDHSLRLAVKDLIDIRGTVTSAGSEYVYKNSKPATQDAACLAGARAQHVQIVGKTNLTEFAATVSGINTYFGTPRVPMRHSRRLIPGGSSSGSAVAVASNKADVAFGTDTAGSIRIPAACCAVLGLKTTYGLVPLQGVFPLSPKRLDTVGPLAKDVPHLVEGMDLLTPGFTAKYQSAEVAQPSGREIRIGRLYLSGTDASIEKAIDDALAAKHFHVIQLNDTFKDQWLQAQKDARAVALADVWKTLEIYSDKEGVDPRTKAEILLGSTNYPDSLREAMQRLPAWQHALHEIFKSVDFIALPTLQSLPPEKPTFLTSALFEARVYGLQNTAAVNYAGNPALAIPVPLHQGGRSPRFTSLQLIAPRLKEAQLVNAARILESKDEPLR